MALESARKELAQLARRRERVDSRAEQIRKTIEALLPAESDAYRAALESARGELNDLEPERGVIDDRAKRLRRIIEALAPLVEGEVANMSPADFFGAVGVGAEPGITDAIRAVFSAYSGALTPTQVRDGLMNLGWDTGRYKNPMATIQAILSRLKERGEIVDVSAGGKTMYAGRAHFDAVTKG